MMTARVVLLGLLLVVIIRVEVKTGIGFIVKPGSYVASTIGVTLDTRWKGSTNGMFGSEVFMLRTSGQGDMFLNTYDIIHNQLLQLEKKDD